MELMRFLPVRALPKPERLRYLFSFDFDDTLFTLGGPAEERSIFLEPCACSGRSMVFSGALIRGVTLST